MSRVFDYHEAMGIDLTSDKQKALTKKRAASFDFVPLRSVYTSLFSTGLHLQNSLLKVRQLEKIFDIMEKRRSDKSATHEEGDGCTNKELSPLSPPSGTPSQAEIVQWLRGFEEIQGELNACVGCLDEGVSQIDRLQEEDKDKCDGGKHKFNKTDDNFVGHGYDLNSKDLPKTVVPLVDNDDPKQHLDEVFEAVIKAERDEDESGGGKTTFNSMLTKQRKEELAIAQRKINSEKRLMEELKHVLVGKQAEHERREAIALARQENGSVQHRCSTELNERVEYEGENLCDEQDSSQEEIIVTNYSNVPVDAECGKVGTLNGKFKKRSSSSAFSNSDDVIMCNEGENDTQIQNNISFQTKKFDPFCRVKGGSSGCDSSSKMNGFKSTTSVAGFEDSFVSTFINVKHTANAEPDSSSSNDNITYMNGAQSRDSGIVLSNYNSNNFVSSPMSPTVDRQTQTASVDHWNVAHKINYDHDNHLSHGNSGRKYIPYIFEKTIDYQDTNEDASMVNRELDVDSNGDVTHDDISTTNRSRDLPLLDIEKSYFAASEDSAESASEEDSTSSDQGTVKMLISTDHQTANSPGQEDSSSSSLRFKSSANEQIPRSISGQVLTDDEEDYYDEDLSSSHMVDYGEGSNYPTKLIVEAHGQQQSEHSSNNSDYEEESSLTGSSSSEEADEEVESSSDDAGDDSKEEDLGKAAEATIGVEPNDKIFIQSHSLESPVSTNSLGGSSDASSIVFTTHPAEDSKNAAEPLPGLEKSLPMSMTSSFCSSFCYTTTRNGKAEEDATSPGSCSLSDIRSLSTPDLKRIAIATSTSSPYISLEDLTPKASENEEEFDNSSDDGDCSSITDTYTADSNIENMTSGSYGDDDTTIVDEGSVESSNEWGSADELDHHVLKTYRRPLRPAVTATTTVVPDMEEENGHASIEAELFKKREKRKEKRRRNQSIIHSEKTNHERQSQDNKKGNSYYGHQSIEITKTTLSSQQGEDTMKDKTTIASSQNMTKEKEGKEKVYNPFVNNANAVQSVYLARKQKEGGSSLKLSLPRNPLGFDSFLATQVAEKAKHFRTGFSSTSKNHPTANAEEVFGDPSTDDSE